MNERRSYGSYMVLSISVIFDCRKGLYQVRQSGSNLSPPETNVDAA
jgi:hypothetical protein